MHSPKIMDCLVSRLRAAGRGRWAGIAQATGLTHTGVRKLAYGERTNPGVQDVQALLDYFAAIDRGERALPEPMPGAPATPTASAQEA